MGSVPLSDGRVVAAYRREILLRCPGVYYFVFEIDGSAFALPNIADFDERGSLVPSLAAKCSIVSLHSVPKPLRFIFTRTTRGTSVATMHVCRLVIGDMSYLLLNSSRLDYELDVLGEMRGLDGAFHF